MTASAQLNRHASWERFSVHRVVSRLILDDHRDVEWRRLGLGPVRRCSRLRVHVRCRRARGGSHLRKQHSPGHPGGRGGPPLVRNIRLDAFRWPLIRPKDLVDIQVVVADLDTAIVVAEEGKAAGFVRVCGPLYGTDRYGNDHPEEVLVDADPGRPVNINIRPVTAPIWRETLLFRDWLRTHPEGRDEYVRVKRSLAARPDRDVDDYSVDKMPFISEALARATRWARLANWRP